jgi:hypothetical protein
MRGLTLLLCGVFILSPFTRAQHASPDGPDNTSNSVTAPVVSNYTPPTHAERFRTYLKHTYGIASFLEAGVRAGIDQGLDRPSEWQEGALGYAERYGSAMGMIVVRGTTNYALGELFREDLRREPCQSPCSTSKFKLAFEDTFTARKGSDGHRALSIARLIGPISATLVAGTWRPDGIGRRADTVKGIGLTYTLVYIRNLVRDLARP